MLSSFSWLAAATVDIGLAYVIPTAIAQLTELEDRQSQRIAQTCHLVTQNNVLGYPAKRPTLEYLKGQNLHLTDIDPATDEF